MRTYIAYVSFALLIGGCASVQRPAAPLVLENTGTEYPTMCMLLQADGGLTFRGGFAFYSPATWRRADGDTLIITLGGKEPFPAEVFREQLTRHDGLLGFDEKRREISYRFNDKSEFLDFGNYYFYRAAACHAQ